MSPEFDASLPRVLHVGKYFPPDRGGIETYLADLVGAQRATGQAAFALVHGEPRDDDPDWLVRVPVGFSLVFAPIAPRFPLELDRAIRRFKPDLLHLHVPNLSALWALVVPSALRLPWVVHWHADIVPSRIRKKLALAYHFYRPLESALLDRSTRIIATSDPYLKASEPLAPWRDKCSVIPLGVEPVRLRETMQVVRGDEHRQGFRIVSIGRLTYYKGFETLIAAIAELPRVELDIVGEGEERNALLARIASLPAADARRIRLHGAVDDAEKFRLLQACDLFCLASRERTEAFGVAILEAMAMAKPCLVTDLPGSGMPWLVDSAECGWLARLDDVQDWQEKILRLSEDPLLRRRLGLSGQKALEARFSIHQSVTALNCIYPFVRPRGAQRSNATLIVIPARDEAETIGSVITRLKASGWHEIVVINDHSRDATGEIAQRHGAIVLEPALPLGAWGAMQTGIRYALRRGFTGVVTMDADGQHEVSELPNLMRASEHSDVVIGACPERGSRLRRIAWAWFRKIAGFSLADLTSGFRYYNRRAIEILASDEATLLDYQDVGVLLLLRRGGMRISEVPVAMNLRQAGKSRIFHSWLAVATYMAQTTLLCLAHWRPTKRYRTG